MVSGSKRPGLRRSDAAYDQRTAEARSEPPLSANNADQGKLGTVPASSYNSLDLSEGDTQRLPWYTSPSPLPSPSKDQD